MIEAQSILNSLLFAETGSFRDRPLESSSAIALDSQIWAPACESDFRAVTSQSFYGLVSYSSSSGRGICNGEVATFVRHVST